MFPIKIHSEKDVNGKFIHTIRYELTPDNIVFSNL